jgi:hypothetical protein
MDLLAPFHGYQHNVEGARTGARNLDLRNARSDDYGLCESFPGDVSVCYPAVFERFAVVVCFTVFSIETELKASQFLLRTVIFFAIYFCTIDITIITQIHCCPTTPEESAVGTPGFGPGPYSMTIMALVLGSS